MDIIAKLAASLNRRDEVPNQEFAEVAKMPEGNMKIHRCAAIYFAIQGLAVVVWWGLLYFVPVSRQYFVLERNSETSLIAFWLADISFLGIGSLVAGWLCFRNHQYMRIASWFVTGAVSYVAVYCLTLAMMTDFGWLGVTLMVPAMIWSGASFRWRNGSRMP